MAEDFDSPDFLSAGTPKPVDEAKGNVDPIILENVNELITLDADIAYMEEQMAEKKKQRLRISSEVIPALFAEKEYTLLKLKNGLTIEIKETLRASVPVKDEAARAVALQFLEDNEGGSLIKEEISLSAEYAETLQASNIPFDVARTVNTNSLVSWLSGKLGMKKGSLQTLALSDIPPALSPFMQKETKISK